MTDSALDDDDRDDGRIVEWYSTRPVTVSTAVASGAVIAAFALGALTAVGVLALIGQFDD